MSNIMEDINRSLQYPIDYTSQRSTQYRHKILLAVGALISCIIGFITQSILQLLICYGCFIVLTLIMIVPAYAKYNKNRLSWVSVKVE